MTTTTLKAPMRTPELMQRLERHYIAPSGMPGGVFVPECGVNGSFGSSSRCDALHVGFTSTSGRILTGHEVKVSRSDWLHELKQIDKADWWADQCHAWYLVVSDPDIVKTGELPVGWGLMAPTARTRTRLRVLTAATVQKDRQPSWDTVRSMMARLDTLQRSALAEIRSAIDKQVREQVAAEVKQRETAALTYEQQRGLDTLTVFEETFGIKLGQWTTDRQVTPADLKAAVQIVRDATALSRGQESLPVLIRELHAAQEAASSTLEHINAFRSLS